MIDFRLITFKSPQFALRDRIGFLGGIGNPWDDYINVPIGSRYYRKDGAVFLKRGPGDNIDNWQVREIVDDDCEYDEEAPIGQTTSDDWIDRVELILNPGSWVIYTTTTVFNKDDGWEVRLYDATNMIEEWYTTSKSEDDFQLDSPATLILRTISVPTNYKLQYSTREGSGLTKVAQSRIFASRCYDA